MSRSYFEVTSEKVGENHVINRYFFVSNDSKQRIDGREKQILKEILKDFQCSSDKNNSKKYYQVEQIMNLCEKRLDRTKTNVLNNKRVNRKKSRKIQIIIFGLSVVTIANLFSSCGGKKSGDNSKTTVSTEVTSTTSTEYIEENTSVIEDTSSDVQEELETTPEAIVDAEEEENNDEDILVFEYEADEVVSKKSLENALRYKDLFIKYGEMYGVPWELLCAMAAQENHGIHDADYNEPAIGIMQVERDALINHTFKVYNYDTNSIEKFTVKNNNDQLEDLEYNIKTGAIELADCFRVAYSIAVKEGKIEVTNGLAYGTQRYNFGGGNMSKTLNNDGNWMDNRDFIDSGDRRYFEKLFDGVKKLGCDVLCVKYYDEEAKEVHEVKTKIVNTYNKKKSK